MEVIERIHNCKDEEQLYWLTKKLIKEAMYRAKGFNKYRGLIGTKSEINRKEFDFYPNHKDRISFSVPFWSGYIPLNTKIVYGIACGKKFNFDSNCGYYYYVDDDSYVYTFIKLIKEWEIEDAFDIVSLINGFSKRLFEKLVDPQRRMQMHKLLLKEDYVFFEPTKEHSIKDFYGNGSAQCTEYALIANNLLNVLGIPTYYCMDKSHAFNVMFLENDKEDYDGYLLDYSESIPVYNAKNEYVGKYPFYEKIETEKKRFLYVNSEDCEEIPYDKTKEEIEEEENFFEDFVNKGKRIKTNDFFAIIINDRMFKAPTKDRREYGVECNEVEEKKILVKRKEKCSIVL